MEMKWIPCSERLPEKSGKVLVCTEIGYMEVVNYSAKYKRFNDYDECPRASTGFSDTVAWMPLPEPYRKDDEK